jgi:hypothetical protein
MPVHPLKATHWLGFSNHELCHHTDDVHTTLKATHWLGFSTDNGAYYYYNTAPGKFAPGSARENYQDTLLGVHAYAEKEAIPYKHVLLDSWWYVSLCVCACLWFCSENGIPKFQPQNIV